MSKIKIYLDNCCFNRPYDDQNQLKIELETKAKLFIQALIVNGKVDLVISYILELENDDNPFEIRKLAIQDFFKYAKEDISESSHLLKIAEEIKETGVKTKDALHIASAIAANCDYFISTDSRLLKLNDTRIKIINPVDFVMKKEGI
ncbi:type II toxin-antitoxin system VapC family toxin [Candidatus Desulfosporosinus nitrosoreducens]|uniref:type II toxin-antitoxin system VapC family toxin n=1 Tax=Candidatus Desulfosporosinus nitrosoreducens TaxID=3401928 RepID=UPI00280AE27F|nr:PIN domain-containing protein [Desulfosporosinus sp. PR]